MINKVIGIGETVYDIIFSNDNVPMRAVPGGSVYNAMISIGRSGHRGTFISEVGNDRVGEIIRKFLRDNGIDDSCVSVFAGTRSALSLAFLDENKNAQYQFYKDPERQQIAFAMPTVSEGDIVLFGSYFAVNQVIRDKVRHVLVAGRAGGALLYYDINFRRAHSHERDAILPLVYENMRMSDIVKASDEDVAVLFGDADFRRVYREHISACCPLFVCTEGAAGATLLTPDGEHHVTARQLVPVSTIGAGDNFNAGVVSSLLSRGVRRGADNFVSLLSEAMAVGIDYASEVCMTLDNYIGKREA